MTAPITPIARDRKRRPDAKRRSQALRRARADKARGLLLEAARKGR